MAQSRRASRPSGSTAETVIAEVRRGALLAGDARVLVLLSGGRDSVCLLDVACQLRGPSAVHALHVNYGLRTQAAGDERHCRRLAERMGIGLTVDGVAPGERRAGNLQAWARERRYRSALALAAVDGSVVATGHTASDQAETVLYRLAASPGRRALRGISARRGAVVRPLLGITRAQSAAYCLARGLSWREDVTNAQRRFARGRVRHDLLPALRSLHPSAEANVAATARLLADEGAVLDQLLSDAVGPERTIALRRLAELPRALGRLVLVDLAEEALGGLAPRVSGRLEDILALAGHGGTVTLDVGDGVRAVVEYGVLRMSAAPLPSAPHPAQLSVPGSVRFGAWRLRSEVAGSAEAAGQPGGGAWAVLDAAALSVPLTLRAWRHGDRMRPAGRGGSRLLSDLFTERRVPREARAGVPVVLASDEIAWVPGVAAGERFGVTARTREAVRLTARSEDPPTGPPAAGDELAWE